MISRRAAALVFGALGTFIREAYKDPVWILFTALFSFVLCGVAAFSSSAFDRLASLGTESLNVKSFDSQVKLVRQVSDRIAKTSNMTLRAMDSAASLDGNRLSDRSYFPQIRGVVKEMEDARQQVAFAAGMLDAVDFSNPALAKFKPLNKRDLECQQKTLRSVEAVFVALLSRDRAGISRSFDDFAQARRDFRACADTFKIADQDFTDSMDNAVRANQVESEVIDDDLWLLHLERWLAGVGVLYLYGFVFAVWIAWSRRIRRALSET